MPRAGKDAGSSVTKRQTQSLAKLLAAGPSAAGGDLEKPPTRKPTSRPDFERAMRDLVETHHLGPEAQKLVVRAARNAALRMGLEDGDPKTILAATKEMASDPALGLTGPQQQVVVVSLDAAKSLMEKSLAGGGKDGSGQGLPAEFFEVVEAS